MFANAKTASIYVHGHLDAAAARQVSIGPIQDADAVEFTSCSTATPWIGVAADSIRGTDSGAARGSAGWGDRATANNDTKETVASISPSAQAPMCWSQCKHWRSEQGYRDPQSSEKEH